MTPKEKAQELLGIYRQEVNGKLVALYYAAICVDQIIKAKPQCGELEVPGGTVNAPNLYWQHVKQELEKM